MPFVLPPGVAEGSQQALYLIEKYRAEQMEGVGAGDGSMTVGEASLVPLGYQQIKNDDLISAQPLAVPAGATIADVENNGSQPCRWRDDGVMPTAEEGRVINGDSERRFNGNLAALRFIRGGDGVTLDVSYYKLGSA
jgi:hypothetical protein